MNHLTHLKDNQLEDFKKELFPMLAKPLLTQLKNVTSLADLKLSEQEAKNLLSHFCEWYLIKLHTEDK